MALGKHDALHRGHRALVAAAAEMGGAPWLVSFSGMAEVLGWPARLPLVAPCDRRRVLAGWAPHCQGRTPRECAIPFAEVRCAWAGQAASRWTGAAGWLPARAQPLLHCRIRQPADPNPRSLSSPPCTQVRTMSPEAFVELLAAELQVAGVVVGANYRFGYRAAGTTEVLRSLGPTHGLRIRVLDLVAGGSGSSGGSSSGDAQHAQHAQPVQQQQHAQPAQQQQQQQASQQESQQPASADAARRAADRQAAHAAVSSSRVRHALAHGDVADAALCLDRPYRLVASLAEDPATSALPDGAALRLPAAALLNQPPAPGRYAVRAALVGADTLQALGPERQAVLGIDEAGITLHGGAELLGAAAAAGARHLTLDFVGGERGSAPAPQPSAL